MGYLPQSVKMLQKRKYQGVNFKMRFLQKGSVDFFVFYSSEICRTPSFEWPNHIFWQFFFATLHAHYSTSLKQQHKILDLRTSKFLRNIASVTTVIGGNGVERYYSPSIETIVKILVTK